MEEFTLEKSLMNVNNVGSVLVYQETLGNMKEFTLRERNICDLDWPPSRNTAVGFAKRRWTVKLFFFNIMKAIWKTYVKDIVLKICVWFTKVDELWWSETNFIQSHVSSTLVYISIFLSRGSLLAEVSHDSFLPRRERPLLAGRSRGWRHINIVI